MIRMLAAALVLACATPAQAQSAGAWEGIGFQVDAGGQQSEWTMRVTMDAKGRAEVSYPTLGCAAVWTRVGEDTWREKITKGDCVDGGTVALFSKPGRLFYYWTGEGTEAPGVSASAVLYPANGIS